MSVSPTGALTIVPDVIATLVKVPAAGVESPITVLLIVEPVIVPPVMATALAFWVDMVPKPVIDVLGIVVLAVITPVPLPYT